MNNISLKSKIKHSLSWSTLNFGFSQALRFVSNIVLTKLLYPEAFGLMIIAQSIIVGLILMSDLGIKTVIIQHHEGDDESFLNTAWMMMIGQGLIVFLLTLPISFLAANHYKEPILAGLIITIGFISIISSFESTKTTSARRHMFFGKITMFGMASQIITVVSTLFFAWLLKSVWSIVLGNLIGAIFNTFSSHLFFDGKNNRFAFNQESCVKIFHISKWIILGSTLTFFAGEGNKLVIGHYLTFKELAIYGIATNLSGMAYLLTQVFGNGLFPALSEVYRTAPEKFLRLLTKTRLLLINSSVALLVVLIIFGPKITDYIYDSRYDGVGEYLRILSIGSIIGSLGGSYVGVLMAIGKAKLNTYLLVAQIFSQLISMYIGYKLGGSFGVVIGISIVNIIMYIFNSFIYYKLKIWQPKIDIPYILLALIFYFIYY